mmetsp:Transcript_5353/g.15540  ORF Transcript_5353/g.15540 Transcript_5353/m.15540 type:complete len:388 (+) Transcript_5353:1734-2897(+)
MQSVSSGHSLQDASMRDTMPLNSRRSNAPPMLLVSVVGQILKGGTVVHVAGFQEKSRSKIRDQRDILGLGVVLEAKHDPEDQVFFDHILLVPLEFPQIVGRDGPANLVVGGEGAVPLGILLSGNGHVAVLPGGGGSQWVILRKYLPGDAVLKDNLVGPVGSPLIASWRLDHDGVVIRVRNPPLAIDRRPVHVLDAVVGVVAGRLVHSSRSLLVRPVLDLPGLESVGETANVQVGLDANDVVVQEACHVVAQAGSEPRNLGVVLVTANTVPGLQVSAHFNLDFHHSVGHQREGGDVVVVAQDADHPDLKGGARDSPDVAVLPLKFVPPHGFPVRLLEDAHEVFGDLSVVAIVLDDREERRVFGTVQAQLEGGVLADLPVGVKVDGLPR